MRPRVLVVIAVLILLMAPRVSAEDKIVEIIRLHVHAHSDAPEEQRLKLVVRDELLRGVRELLGDAENFAESASIIERSLPRLTANVQASLQAAKSEHRATVKWGIFLFPSRVYGTSALPAGRYPALNIHIGAGQGRNWWCVMYPPLCFVDGVVTRGQGRTFELAFINLLRNMWRRLLRAGT